MKKQIFVWVFAALAISACWENVEGQKPDDSITSLAFSISKYQVCDPETGGMTKTSYVDNGSILWAEHDTIGIYPNQGSQVYFEIVSGAGSSNAAFDGGGWGLKSSYTYYSYYPFIGDIYLDKNRIPVSYEGQKQVGSATNHIGPFDFMYASGTSAQNGQLSFNYSHLNSLLRFIVSNLPAGPYGRLSISAPSPVFVKNGYYDLLAEHPAIVPIDYTSTLQIDLEGVTLVEGSNVVIYLMTAPVNLNGVTVTVSMLNSERKEYQCQKTPSREYLAEGSYYLTCNTWTEVPQSVGFSMENWGSGGSIGGNAQ